MDALTLAAPVHYYDTSLRRILCGLRVSEHRSTKHSRNVTCTACLGLMGRTLAAPAPAATGSPPGVA